MRYFITTIAFLLICLCPTTAQAAMRGDLNNDGNIDVTDINILIDMVLGKTPKDSCADINGSGDVDVADVNAAIDLIFTFAPRVYTVNGVTFQLNEVAEGKFYMGATVEQGGWDNERPVHRVILSPYFIGQTEVTQELWTAVMESNPSYFKGSNRPVESISYDDCLAFLERLDSITGVPFRLPTEAEWEFAAKGGMLTQETLFAGNNDCDLVAWWGDETNSGTHPVAQLEPNELGIFDMSGNVWEWCHDWYNYYSSGRVTDPQGRTTGLYRVQRGGAWNFSSAFCRCTSRAMGAPDNKTRSLGFRIALSKNIDPQEE